MDELFDLYARYKRGKEEPAQIALMIESEGGEVLEHRQVSRLVPSPFKGLRVFPLLYAFRVRYGSRRGCWYVRTSGDKGGYEWAWVDFDGYETLPVVKPYAYACVARDVRVVGWVADWIVVLGSIGLGVLVFVVIFWVWF